MNKQRIIKEPRELIVIALLVLSLSLVTTAQRPGSLDPTFGIGGYALPYAGQIVEMVVQADGKIVVTTCTIVVRLQANGSADASFGSGGAIVFPNTVANPTCGIALSQAGKIAVITHPTPPGPNSQITMLTSTGQLDPSFGVGGVAMWSDGWLEQVLFQADGKIVASGYNWGFDLVRFNTNGTVDTGYGQNGRVYLEVEADSIAIQNDGKILVGGWLGLERVNTDGSRDNSFNPPGVFASDIAIQPDGKIITSGGVLTRINSDGSPDPTFGQQGSVEVPFYGTGVAVQPDGKIVVAGYTCDYFECWASSSYLARYRTDGSLDLSFGNGGTIFPLGSSSTYPYNAALDVVIQRGKIVVGGYGFANSDHVTMARFLAGSDAPFDYDGDGRSDISVFRPSDSVWYLNRSTDGFFATQFGLPTDQLVPADYDGDGKTDIAVYRDGTWWIRNSSNNAIRSFQFGIAGDIPVPGDYTGDGRDELAVYRNGQWWALDLTNNQPSLINFGVAGDKPVPADFDGDGRFDQAVYRNGQWHINRSNLGLTIISWGLPSDRPVVGDYDGDGKADPAVYRDGTWYALQSTEGWFEVRWGLSTDVPVPADYDGDGSMDPAVFRDGTWYLLRSNGGVSIQHLGLTGDQPLAASFIR